MKVVVDILAVYADSRVGTHREEQIGSADLFYERSCVQIEIAYIAEVDVFKRVCENGQESVSVAVLEDNESSSVLAVSLYVGYLLSAPKAI